jgi:hypothetical protein
MHLDDCRAQPTRDDKTGCKANPRQHHVGRSSLQIDYIDSVVYLWIIGRVSVDFGRVFVDYCCAQSIGESSGSFSPNSVSSARIQDAIAVPFVALCDAFACGLGGNATGARAKSERRVAICSKDSGRDSGKCT